MRKWGKLLLILFVAPLLLGGEMKDSKGKDKRAPIFNALTGKVEEAEKIYMYLQNELT